MESREAMRKSRGHGKLKRPWETREAMGNSRGHGKLESSVASSRQRCEKIFEKGEVLIKFIIFANVIDKIVIYYLLYINLYS